MSCGAPVIRSFTDSPSFTFTDSGNDVKTVLNLLKKTCVTPTSNLPIKIGIGLWLRLIGQTIKIPDITISPSITCPEGIDQLTQGA